MLSVFAYSSSGAIGLKPRTIIEVNRRVLMSGETDETNLALLLRLVQCFDHSTLGEVQVRVVFIDVLVNLPEVQMIGLDPGSVSNMLFLF